VAKRFSRKKAKQDEFVSTIEKIYEFSEKNVKKYAKPILISLGIILLFGIISFSINHYRTSREEKAQILLSKALKHFNAAVIQPGEDIPQELQVPTYSTEEEKYQASLKYLQEVVDKYHSTPSGAMASYYQGLSYAHLNRFDEAQNKFNQSLHDPLPKIMVPLARYALARAHEAKKEYEQAIKIYSKIYKKHSDFIPKDEALMRMGFCYDKLNKKDKAIEQYRTIVNEYENSIYKSEAQNRLDAIASPTSANKTSEKP
jgi:tetratricopeptide (TPR) repeat protein